MKKAILSWVAHPVIILLIIDTLLGNLWVFWKNVDSDNPIFAIEDKHVDLWVWDLTVYTRFTLLTIAIAIMYIKKVRMETKQIWFTAIYFIMSVKDIADFLQRGNQGTLLADIFIFLVTIIVCEAISEVTQNRSHGNG